MPQLQLQVGEKVETYLCTETRRAAHKGWTCSPEDQTMEYLTNKINSQASAVSRTDPKSSLYYVASDAARLLGPTFALLLAIPLSCAGHQD